MLLRMDRKQQRLFVSVLLLLLYAVYGQAEPVYHTYTGRKAAHYLGVSFSGGEANNISVPASDSVKHKGGAALNLGLQYEINYASWIFGLGVEVQYQYLRDKVVTPFSDEEGRSYTVVESPWPVFQDSVRYTYQYADYMEMGHNGSAAFSLYIGKEFMETVYFLVGAKLTLPISTAYNVRASLSTRARYEEGIESIEISEENGFTVEQVHAYGIFDEQTYSYKSTYKDHIRIAPFVEIGYNVPVPFLKTRMRIGLYGAYGFRFGNTLGNRLADYSMVEKGWGVAGEQYTTDSDNGMVSITGQQSADMLQNTLRWNPLIQSVKYTSLPHNLEIGAKLTFLFDVTQRKKLCRCETM